MIWVYFPLIAGLLWAIVNHIDKYLLSEHLKSGGVGALVMFSSLVYLLVIPFLLLFFHNEVLDGFALNTICLILAGIVYTILWSISYFKALLKDDTSTVIAIFQTIPIFAYIYGLILFKEELSLIQIIGGLTIIGGAIGISIDTSMKKIKSKVLVLMLASSASAALNNALVKLGTTEDTYFVYVLFWQYIGAIIAGIFLYIFVKKYRTQFLQLLQQNSIKILSLNVVNEALNSIGIILIYYVSLKTFLSIAWLGNAVQPVASVLIGIILTIFFPHIAKEDISKKKLFQKLLFIGVMILGVIIMNLPS